MISHLAICIKRVSVANVFLKKYDQIHKENEPTFYTLHVAYLKNLSGKKTTKEVMYSSNKLRSEEEFGDINLRGICQGNRHQVSLNEPTAQFPSLFVSGRPFPLFNCDYFGRQVKKK